MSLFMQIQGHHMLLGVSSFRFTNFLLQDCFIVEGGNSMVIHKISQNFSKPWLILYTPVHMIRMKLQDDDHKSIIEYS